MAKGHKGHSNGVYRPEDHVSVDMAAGKIGCSRMTVLRLLDLGKLAGCRFTDHGWWHVSKVSLAGYLASLRAQENGRKVKVKR